MRSILILSLSCYIVFVACQTVNNVRLVDHTTYMIQLVQKTVDRIQKNNWVALAVQDVEMDIDEHVVGINSTFRGRVKFTNGFIVSMQHIDLVQSTVQQAWLHNRNANITTLELRGTVRMHDVAIGYDIDANLDTGKYYSTGVFVHPLVQFQCALIKNLYTDELSSTVVPVLLRTTNNMKIVPEDDLSLILSVMFDWNSTNPSVQSWSNKFAATLLDLAETEHPIPEFCYNCPA